LGKRLPGYPIDEFGRPADRLALIRQQRDCGADRSV
jgi:hypothetical protein